MRVGVAETPNRSGDTSSAALPVTSGRRGGPGQIRATSPNGEGSRGVSTSAGPNRVGARRLSELDGAFRRGLSPPARHALGLHSGGASNQPSPPVPCPLRRAPAACEGRSGDSVASECDAGCEPLGADDVPKSFDLLLHPRATRSDRRLPSLPKPARRTYARGRHPLTGWRYDRGRRGREGVRGPAAAAAGTTLLHGLEPDRRRE